TDFVRGLGRVARVVAWRRTPVSSASSRTLAQGGVDPPSVFQELRKQDVCAAAYRDVFTAVLETQREGRHRPGTSAASEPKDSAPVPWGPSTSSGRTEMREAYAIAASSAA